MKEEVYKRWMQLGRKYSQDTSLLESIWRRLVKNYSQKSRYYHNLNHIWAMLQQSEDCKDELEDKDVIDFSIWFHDVIYKSTQKNNEKKSAEFAQKILQKFSLEDKRVEKVYNLIVSTQKHQIIDATNLDNAYLLDFDLSILGQSWSVYESYIKDIRKEYRIYPNFLYNPGRKKVLETFLQRKTLYFTEKYQNLYEQQARENLEREITQLSY